MNPSILPPDVKIAGQVIWLRRSERPTNLNRFYALKLAPTLFGEWALIAEWGRVGSSGKVSHQVFQTERWPRLLWQNASGLKPCAVTCLNVLYETVA